MTGGWKDHPFMLSTSPALLSFSDNRRHTCVNFSGFKSNKILTAQTSVITSTVYLINPHQALYETMKQAFQLHGRVDFSDMSLFQQQ